MRAAIVTEPGALPQAGDFPEPEVAAGHTLVEPVAAGVHPLVRSLVAGSHYGSHGQWPAVPGVDVVARTADGTLVYTGQPQAPWGTIAERVAVPELFAIPLPEGADPVAVAGGLNPGMSTWVPLVTWQQEHPGRSLGTVLVLGVTGMAGTLAVQNALALGATRIIGAGRDATRLERAASFGAETVRLTGSGDDAAIAEALAGESPSVVMDLVWGAPAEAAFAALQQKGLDTGDVSYVQIGSLAGADAAVPSSLLRSRRITIKGSGMGSVDPAVMFAQLPVYMERIARAEVQVPTRTFTLEDVAQAWDASPDERAVVVL